MTKEDVEKRFKLSADLIQLYTGFIFRGTDLLKESLGHEEMAIDLYKSLLDCAENKSLYVEEYAREMIKQEEMHSIEIKKMLRDYEV